LLVLLSFLISRLIIRSGLRISHSKVFSSGLLQNPTLLICGFYNPLSQISSSFADFILYNIYLYTLLVCLSVCLYVRFYPTNFKTAEQIGPSFCVGLVPGKVFRWSKFQKFRSNKNRFWLNFENPRKVLIKSANFLFAFVLQWIQRENVHNWKRRWARSALKALIIYLLRHKCFNLLVGGWLNFNINDA